MISEQGIKTCILSLLKRYNELPHKESEAEKRTEGISFK